MDVIRSPPDRITIESDQAACKRDKAMQRTFIQLAADGKAQMRPFVAKCRFHNFGRSFSQPKQEFHEASPSPSADARRRSSYCHRQSPHRRVIRRGQW